VKLLNSVNLVVFLNYGLRTPKWPYCWDNLCYGDCMVLSALCLVVMLQLWWVGNRGHTQGPAVIRRSVWRSQPQHASWCYHHCTVQGIVATTLCTACADRQCRLERRCVSLGCYCSVTWWACLCWPSVQTWEEVCFIRLLLFCNMMGLFPVLR